jgi:hypothetical protein
VVVRAKGLRPAEDGRKGITKAFRDPPDDQPKRPGHVVPQGQYRKSAYGVLSFASIICPKWYEAWFVRSRSTANLFRVEFCSNSSAETLPCLSNHS